MKKRVLLIAVLSFVMTISAPAYAQTPAENEPDTTYSTAIAPRYSQIQNFYGQCNVKNGTAAISVFAAAHNENYKVSISATLQKQNGTQWQDVKTWTTTGSGPSGANLAKTYAVASGNYRVKATAKVMDGTKTLETAIIYG